MSYECTLANSFDADYEMYYGTDAAIMLRGSKAWMFKEVDSPLLGWEVYAKKETFYKETGIALVAGASKQENLTNKQDAAVPLENTPIYQSLKNFLSNVFDQDSAIHSFVDSYGADDEA